jgi:uncharacterized protein (TIGR03084 family)
MDEVLTALAAQHRDLDGLLASLDDDGWATPTPRCPGWTVADVVLHLAQTDEMALASLEGRFAGALSVLAAGMDGAANVDDGAAAMVANERGLPPAELLARWRSGSAAVRRALEGTDPSERVLWVAGELAARTLATTRLAECWIHTGDVLAALGRPIEATERIRHIARLAWRTLPYAFSSAGRTLTGPVAFELSGPAGAPWTFAPDEPAATTIRGTALDLCQVAGQRADAADTGLTGEGPDADAVLALVRTFA